MTEDRASWPNVDKFIFDQIDSVPHLEALLLIWSSRPMPWAAEDLAKRLYIELSFAKTISQDLARQNLIAPGEDGRYYYEPNPERDELLASVEAAYRSEMIRVSRMIHSKPSQAVREFANAFRLKKEKK